MRRKLSGKIPIPMRVENGSRFVWVADRRYGTETWRTFNIRDRPEHIVNIVHNYINTCPKCMYNKRLSVCVWWDLAECSFLRMEYAMRKQERKKRAETERMRSQVRRVCIRRLWTRWEFQFEFQSKIQASPLKNKYSTGSWAWESLAVILHLCFRTKHIHMKLFQIWKKIKYYSLYKLNSV